MEEFILQSSELKNDDKNRVETIEGKKVVCDGTVIIAHSYVFKNCEFTYGTGAVTIENHASLKFHECKFNCLGIKEDVFFIDAKDDTVTEFYSCDFDICEQLLRSRANRVKITFHDSNLFTPGEKFVDILMGEDSQVILGNLSVNVDEPAYTENTVVFRIARVTQSVQPLLNNINIRAKKYVPNVKWFLCMGGEVSGGSFVNVCKVFDGVNKVTNAYFENCSQVINWAVPVVRKYGISNGTTAWINENIEIVDNNFINCEKSIGLGYLSKVENCNFRYCVAPMIITSIHGGVTILDNVFDQCKLTSDQYSAFILLSDYQDKMSKNSLVSGCKINDTPLGLNQFVRIILNKNNGGKVVVRKSLRLENCSFVNSVRNSVELIEDRVNRGSLVYDLVDGITSCEFEEKYVEPNQENNVPISNVSEKDENKTKPYDGGNFDEIL